MAASFAVIWSANAARMVAELLDYLTEVMGEHAADAYVGGLVDFGNSLAVHAEHHSFCRNFKLQAFNCRCAIYRKKYVVIYRIDAGRVLILGVLHISRGPEAFQAMI